MPELALLSKALLAEVSCPASDIYKVLPSLVTLNPGGSARGLGQGMRG